MNRKVRIFVLLMFILSTQLSLIYGSDSLAPDEKKSKPVEIDAANKLITAGHLKEFAGGVNRILDKHKALIKSHYSGSLDNQKLKALTENSPGALWSKSDAEHLASEIMALYLDHLSKYNLKPNANAANPEDKSKKDENNKASDEQNKVNEYNKIITARKACFIENTHLLIQKISTEKKCTPRALITYTSEENDPTITGDSDLASFITRISLVLDDINAFVESQSFTSMEFEPAFTGRRINGIHQGNPGFLNIENSTSDLSFSTTSGRDNIIKTDFKVGSSILLSKYFNFKGSYSLDFTSKNSDDIDRRSTINAKFLFPFFLPWDPIEAPGTKDTTLYWLLQFFRHESQNRRIATNQYGAFGAGCFIPYNKEIQLDIEGLVIFYNKDKISVNYLTSNKKWYYPNIDDLTIKYKDVEIPRDTNGKTEIDAPYQDDYGYVLRATMGFSYKILGADGTFDAGAELFCPDFADTHFVSMTSSASMCILKTDTFKWDITPSLSYYVDFDKEQRIKPRELEDFEREALRLTLTPEEQKDIYHYKTFDLKDNELQFEPGRDHELIFSIGFKFTIY